MAHQEKAHRSATKRHGYRKPDENKGVLQVIPQDEPTTCKELSIEELEELCEAFHLFDQENKGFINPQKLFHGMRALGYNPTEAEVLDLISAIDNEGNYKVTIDEFISMMSDRIKKTPTDEELTDVFRVFDVDGNGKITVNDVDKLFFKLGLKIDRQELKEMLSAAGLQDVNSINFQDFVSIYKGEP